MLPIRPLAVLALSFTATLPAAAQTVSDYVTGSFVEGAVFDAELYRNAEHLVLRIWEGPTVDDLTLTFDNTRFDWTPINGREWLDADTAGELVVMTTSENDGYLYSTRTVLTKVDGMLIVARHDLYNNRLNGPAPEDVFRCFSDECWSCEADLVAATAMAGGETIIATVPWDSLDATLWSPDQIHALGLCPVPS